MKTDHIIICIAFGVEGAAMRCEHCTLQYVPAFPMPLEKYAEQAKGFALMHRRCEKPAEPSRQMTLPHHAYAVDAPVTDGTGGRFPDITYVDEGDMETEDECCARTVREEMAAELVAGHGPLQALGIDGMSDAADPETDPPGHDGPELTTYAEFETGHYAGFAQAYPAPKTRPELTGLLSTLFAPSEWGTADIVAKVKRWDPATATFQHVAHWARTRHARQDAQDRVQRGDTARSGVTIPVAAMPAAIAKALGGTKPKRSRKAKATPGTTEHPSDNRHQPVPD